MRAVFLSLFILLSTHLLAIDFKLGVMAGANTSLNQLYTYSDITRTDPKLGYNANLFARCAISHYVIQPEMGYLMNRVGITVNENGQDKESNLNLGQLYTTVLMGFKFSKLRFSIGPMIQFTSNQSFDALGSSQSIVKEVNAGRANLGAMADIGLDITKRWSLDMRVSRTFTQAEYQAAMQNKSINFVGNTGMVSIMLGYTLFKTK